MNLTPLDVAAVVFYFALMVALAFLTRRTKTFQEFAVGKHSVPTTMIFASLAATIVGPGFSIGVTGKGWGMGFLFYYLMLSYALQVILVGLYFAPRLSRERDCNTLGDVMRKRYGRFTQLLTGIISVGLCVGFTAIMGKIGGAMLHDVTAWPLGICIVAVTGVTALLTFTGGIRATIATEAVQFSLKSIVVPVMLLLAIVKSPHSLATVSGNAAALTAQAYAGMTGWQMFGISLSFALGEVLLPPYANRALAAKSEAASRSGFLMAGGFTVIWFAIVSALGIVAHGLIKGNPASDDIFITIGRAVLPSGVFGLLLATMVAIIMSSQESVLNSSAVAFVRDVVGIFFRLSESATLSLAKVSTLLIAALAIFVARYSPSIIDGLLVLYSLWAPTILLPLLLGLHLRNTKPLASWLSIIGGGAASLIWHLEKEPGGIPAIVVGLAVAGVMFALGHFIGTAAQSEQLKPVSI